LVIPIIIPAPTPSLRTAMVTFVLTDVEGSTRLWEEDVGVE
jgi:class 3 adenylate cyclase